MPGVVVFLSMGLATLIVGSELMAVYAVFQARPWGEWWPLLMRVVEIAEGRLFSATPLLPYAAAAVIAGLMEGVYWRSRQRWRGYHRSLWQLALAPMVWAVALLLSWVIALDEPGWGRLWIVCGLLILTAFALSAGYKVSSTR